MKKLFTYCMMLFIGSSCYSQTNNEVLMKEATARLDSTNDVSTILTDKQFLTLHPETSFRELIKKYAIAKPLTINTAEEPGNRIKIIVTVRDEKNNPVNDFLVYLYQTDSRGWYTASGVHVGGNEGDMRHARLFGYVKTDKEGKIILYTVKPSGYPGGELPAHIHVHFDSPGYNPVVTEFLFDDDSRLVGKIRADAIAQRYPIAKPETRVGFSGQQFQYSIVVKAN